MLRASRDNSDLPDRASIRNSHRSSDIFHCRPPAAAPPGGSQTRRSVLDRQVHTSDIFFTGNATSSSMDERSSSASTSYTPRKDRMASDIFSLNTTLPMSSGNGNGPIGSAAMGRRANNAVGSASAYRLDPPYASLGNAVPASAYKARKMENPLDSLPGSTTDRTGDIGYSPSFTDVNHGGAVSPRRPSPPSNSNNNGGNIGTSGVDDFGAGGGGHVDAGYQYDDIRRLDSGSSADDYPPVHPSTYTNNNNNAANTATTRVTPNSAKKSHYFHTNIIHEDFNGAGQNTVSPRKPSPRNHHTHSSIRFGQEPASNPHHQQYQYSPVGSGSPKPYATYDDQSNASDSPVKGGRRHYAVAKTSLFDIPSAAEGLVNTTGGGGGSLRSAAPRAGVSVDSSDLAYNSPHVHDDFFDNPPVKTRVPSGSITKHNNAHHDDLAASFNDLDIGGGGNSGYFNSGNDLYHDDSSYAPAHPPVANVSSEAGANAWRNRNSGSVSNLLRHDFEDREVGGGGGMSGGMNAAGGGGGMGRAGGLSSFDLNREKMGRGRRSNNQYHSSISQITF
ncbi:hypothetical protein HDU76_000033 [Blyttiomyces sp. JEL0837]|nr:hypothetical protein HDU76_000033 [Blyttiomyces sp. JEL0837]